MAVKNRKMSNVLSIENFNIANMEPNEREKRIPFWIQVPG